MFLKGCAVLFSLFAVAHSLGPTPAPLPVVPGVSQLYRINNGTCYGAGRFQGVGLFVGTGVFTIYNGTFNGYGSLSVTTGTYSGNGTCNGPDSTFYSLDKNTVLTGDGTVQGNGTFLVPSGTFVGSGEFQGSEITYYGGEASFQATYGKAVGNHTVTGRNVTCMSDTFGELVGQGAADGTGQLIGNGALDSEDGEFTGTGTFTGVGDCEGATVATS